MREQTSDRMRILPAESANHARKRAIKGARRASLSGQPRRSPLLHVQLVPSQIGFSNLLSSLSLKLSLPRYQPRRIASMAFSSHKSLPAASGKPNDHRRFEHHLSPIATCHDMAHSPRILESQWSKHDPAYTARPLRSSYDCSNAGIAPSDVTCRDAGGARSTTEVF